MLQEVVRLRFLTRDPSTFLGTKFLIYLVEFLSMIISFVVISS